MRQPVMSALAGMAVFLLAGMAFAQSGSGAEIFVHGDDNGVLPCAACHGAAAQGNESIGAPKLAGMKADALKQALGQIAASDGGNGAMRMVARALTPAEADAVANYLASLK